MQNAFLCIIALGASASGLILAAHLQQQGAHAQHAAAPPGAELHGVPRPKKRPKHPDWVHGAPGAAELASARAAKEQIQASLRGAAAAAAAAAAAPPPPSTPPPPAQQPITVSLAPAAPRPFVVSAAEEARAAELEKRKVWDLSGVEMRERLRLMHRAADPDDNFGASWVNYAADAARGRPPRPRANPARQADGSYAYDVAGRRVTTPYGEPESTIFIVTASYRDPEVASTIARAFARAAHPERVVVGVHAQNAGGHEEPERDPIAGLANAGVTCPDHPVCAAVLEGRVRVSRQLWERAEGPTVARALAERHFRNETYVMGVDSHCHFVRGWDNVMIDMFRRIGNDHALITAYPASYTADKQGGDGLEAYEPPTLVKSIGCIRKTRRVNLHNTISFKHDMGSCAAPADGPSRVAFFAAGFSFARGHRVARVPYDFRTPYIFDGEEISMGVRAWTWGYDLYQPDRNVIAHLYIPAGSPLRPVFWTTDWGARWPCQYRSLLRLQEQLGLHKILTPRESLGMVDLGDWGKYAVGPRRDPLDFFRWAKVPVVNEWGENCAQRVGGRVTGKRGKAYCSTMDLNADFLKPGGMAYVPWKAGTEALFPPLVRTASYPPPPGEYWTPDDEAARMVELPTR